MTSPYSAQAYNFLMKGLAAAALAVAIALPACAQRGGGGHVSFGGHTGFASRGAPAPHPAPAFHGTLAPSHSTLAPSHGTLAPSMPMRYSGRPGLAHPPVSYPSSIRLTPGVRYPYPVKAPTNRPTFYHPGHPANRSFYIRTYPYAYPSYVYGYLPTDLLDDSYDNYANYDASQQPLQQQDDGVYPQQAPQPEYGYSQPAPEGPYPPAGTYPGATPNGYAPQQPPVTPQMQYMPDSTSKVTLIFKDGRPPEEIQNYLVMRTTLTVLDGGRRREIPLSDLDVPATVTANRQSGVDFQLPTATPQ